MFKPQGALERDNWETTCADDQHFFVGPVHWCTCHCHWIRRLTHLTFFLINSKLETWNLKLETWTSTKILANLPRDSSKEQHWLQCWSLACRQNIISWESIVESITLYVPEYSFLLWSTCITKLSSGCQNVLGGGNKKCVKSQAGGSFDLCGYTAFYAQLKLL